MTIAGVQVNDSGDDLPTCPMLISISYICEQIHSHGPDKILPSKCNRMIIPIHRSAFVRCSTIGLASIMSPKWSTFIPINDRRMGKWNPNFHRIAYQFHTRAGYKSNEYAFCRRTIGHFTAFVQDKQTHIGCAAINFQMRRNLYAIYLICNYAMTNVLRQPVYATGQPCSECTSGCNDEYPGLCSTSEIIRAMPHDAWWNRQ